MDKFDKLDDQAVKAILVAQEESRRLGYKFVDTEQLLLGLLVEKQGVAGRILENLGLTHNIVRKRINEIRGRGTDVVGVEAPFTESMNQLLQEAARAAESKKSERIRTEHLLAGLSNCSRGVAGQILAEAGIKPETLVAELEKTSS